MANRKGIDSTIVAALIGLCGTVTVTVITIIATRPPQQPVPSTTPTVSFLESTSTATNLPTDSVTPETFTPEASQTPSVTPFFPSDTPIPPPAAGQDWPLNCISEVWQLYPSGSPPTVSNNCHVQPLDRFYTTGGRLGVSFNGRVENTEVHGLFTRLPATGSVRLNIFLQQVQGGEIIMGIFGAPDFNSNGVFIVAPTGVNVQKQQILVKTMPGQSLFAQTTEPIEANPPIYDFLFVYDSGTVRVKTRSDQIDFGSVSLLSPEKWLFIGYQLLDGSNQLQAEFYGLSVTAQ